MKTIRLLSAIGLIIALIVLVVAMIKYAHRNSSVSDNKLTVVSSFYPLYDFTRAVGGTRINAINITPAGAEPHDFDPSPQQLVEASKAKVFVYNGAGLEIWAPKFLHDFRGTVVKSSDGINLRASDGARVSDPHFWLDPVLVGQIIDNITRGLVQADPADASYFANNAKAYQTKLRALDNDFRSQLASCQSRSIIVSHDAFGYLATRYNLTVHSIAGVSPDEEPSAAKLAELSQLVKDQHIKYIFFEQLASPRLSQTIAQETGAQTAVFDPIEGISDADQQQGKNYLSVQRANLAALRLALACQ